MTDDPNSETGGGRLLDMDGAARYLNDSPRPVRSLWARRESDLVVALFCCVLIVSAVKFSCRRAYTVICRSVPADDQSFASPPFGLTWSFSR